MMLAGNFETEEAAQSALRTLLDRYDTSQIRLLMSAPNRRGFVRRFVAPGVRFGGTLGALIGAVLLLAMTLGSGAVELVGVLAVLWTVLQGTVAGAVAGGALGAILAIGYAYDLAGLRRDVIWIGVRTDLRDATAESALLEAGARRLVRVSYSA